jgi:hypothetical protein
VLLEPLEQHRSAALVYRVGRWGYRPLNLNVAKTSTETKKALNERQIVKQIVTVRRVNIKATESAKRIYQPFTFEGPIGGQSFMIRETGKLEGILENLDQTADGVRHVDRTNIYDKRITRKLEPFLGQSSGIRGGMTQPDGMNMRMPALPVIGELIGPNSRTSLQDFARLTRARAAAVIGPQTTGKMIESLRKVGSVLNRKRDQEGG